MRVKMGQLLNSWQWVRWLSSPPLQVHGQKAFCLPLSAFIAQPQRPALLKTVVLQLSALHRGMITLVDVVKNDHSFAVAHHHKAQTVSAPDRRQPGTIRRITQVAEIAQLVVSGM
jgi:hypothetical protein